METDEPARLGRALRAADLRGVYAIVNDGPAVLELAAAALAGGIRIVQYRAKGHIDAGRLRALRDRTFANGAVLIVNDDWRAARAFNCDGVHLGPGDDGYDAPRSVRAGAPGLLIGLSCGTVAEIERANAAGVDYAGVGAVYATSSKPDAGAPIGLDRLSELVRAAVMPVCAIGGIEADRIAAVRTSGAAMAAVIAALSSALDATAAARELVERWNGR